MRANLILYWKAGCSVGYDTKRVQHGGGRIVTCMEVRPDREPVNTWLVTH